MAATLVAQRDGISVDQAAKKLLAAKNTPKAKITEDKPKKPNRETQIRLDMEAVGTYNPVFDKTIHDLARREKELGRAEKAWRDGDWDGVEANIGKADVMSQDAQRRKANIKAELKKYRSLKKTLDRVKIALQSALYGDDGITYLEYLLEAKNAGYRLTDTDKANAKVAFENDRDKLDIKITKAKNARVRLPLNEKALQKEKKHLINVYSELSD